MARSDTRSGWRIGTLLSPAIAPQSADGGNSMAKHVDYYVSLNSPWTYLGSARFDAMAKKYGAGVTIWPVDFGSVFSVSGGLPLPKRAPQRQAYRMMELKRWRAHTGVKLTLEPKFFPSNEVPAAKCVIALREQGRMADAIKVAHAVMAAIWAEEKNPGDPAALLWATCATSDGHRAPLRKRSQPNSRPSGSTRRACAGSTWAAAKASELATRATPPPQRLSSQPYSRPRKTSSSTSGASPASRARLIRNTAGPWATFWAIFIACLTPSASGPTWLTAIDTAAVPSVPNSTGRQPT